AGVIFAGYLTNRPHHAEVANGRALRLGIPLEQHDRMAPARGFPRERQPHDPTAHHRNVGAPRLVRHCHPPSARWADAPAELSRTIRRPGTTTLIGRRWWSFSRSRIKRTACSAIPSDG